MSSPLPVPLHFLSNAPLGMRVVVRYRIDGGLTDALGELVGKSDGKCTVRTQRSDVVIALSLVMAAKEVPPDPPPRSPRATVS